MNYILKPVWLKEIVEMIVGVDFEVNLKDKTLLK